MSFDDGIVRMEGVPLGGGGRSCRQPAGSDGGDARASRVIPWLVLLVMASFAVRLSLFNFESRDYEVWLSRWYDFFVEHGRWRGLGEMTEDISNYPPLYLYFVSLSTLLPVPKLYAIKLISVSCDYVAAWYVWRLALQLTPSRRMALVSVTCFLFLPTVVINGAFWGQCDILYTTGLLASLYYVLRRRAVLALVAFGFSCSLKPQAIFWCPFLAGLFVAGRLPWKWFWIPAAVYVVCGIPSILAGRDVLHVLGHWAFVRNTQPGLTHNAANWYQWINRSHPEPLWWIGVGSTAAATVALVIFMSKGPGKTLVESHWLLLVALLSVLFPPFLLPGMHERYFFAADVLSILYAVHLRGWWPAMLIQVASVFAYGPFLLRRQLVSLKVLAFLVVLATVLVLVDLFFGNDRSAAGRKISRGENFS